MSQSSPKTIYLLDGHALAYRTYFALTRSGFRGTTRAGDPTAGVFGFTSVLMRLLEQERPDYMAVSFDVGKTFRDVIFPEYKGTREKMPDDLRSQMEYIREVVRAFGVPIFEMDGYEADDVLGTVSRLAVRQGLDVVIVTGDRDLLQLVDDQVSISLPGRSISESQLYGPREVAQKFGVTPQQFVDFKALVGDKSDNIPGVTGVGEKTAKLLLQQHLSLEGIYERLPQIEPRFRKKLAADKENAFLSRKLAAIVTDLNLDFDLESCVAPGHSVASKELDRTRLISLFQELEFRSLLKRVRSILDSAGDVGVDEAGSQLSLFSSSESRDYATQFDSIGTTNTFVVDNDNALMDLVDILRQATTIAFDTETTSTDQMRANLVGISLAVAPSAGYYIPVGHHPEMAPRGQLPLIKVLKALSGPLTDPKIEKVGHNVKYDHVVLKRAGLSVSPIGFDTMIAEWLSDPGSRNLSLKNLAWVRLGVEMIDIETLIGTGAKQKSMDVVPVAQVAPYATADADMTLRLTPLLREELQQKNALGLLQEMEIPLIPVLAEMEIAGVMLDIEFLETMSGELQKQSDMLRLAVQRAVGYEFNLNSTQQLSRALFESLSLVPPRGTRRTASGHYSTAASVLEDLAVGNDVVRKVLEYRGLAKLHSTYVKALPQATNRETGRVHTSYNQAGTVTGRLASSNPNLQNIPIRTELGRMVRRAFIAPLGRKLVAVDYSQIELRIAAHLSGDEFLLQAFAEDRDIHAATAAAVFNVSMEDVTNEQRRQAKVVNFGLLYGMGPFRLARDTGMTLGEAEEFIEAYFARVPGIKSYLEDTKKQAERDGFVKTLLGRRRYFPVLGQGSDGVHGSTERSRAEREATNSPIQGTAADIIKLAMLELGRQLPSSFPDAYMLMQVHDELVFECSDQDATPLADLARGIMEGAFSLRIPLRVDVAVGQNWDEMKVLV